MLEQRSMTVVTIRRWQSAATARALFKIFANSIAENAAPLTSQIASSSDANRSQNATASKRNIRYRPWAFSHPDLRADYVLTNPPFNPAMRGTNFAWVQDFIHHLAPHGMAGFVLVRFW